MTKKFTVNCDFGGQMAPVTIYIGGPDSKHNPLYFQSEWLTKDRGGQIPPEVMSLIQELYDMSKTHGITFEDLCVYALGAAKQSGQS